MGYFQNIDTYDFFKKRDEFINILYIIGQLLKLLPHCFYLLVISKQIEIFAEIFKTFISNIFTFIRTYI